MANDNKAQEPAAEAPRRGGWLGKLAIGGFMAVVILGECIFAYFCIPSADDVAARAKATHSTEDGSEPGEGSAPAEETNPVKEIDLGNYSLTAHQPASDTTLRLDFHLVGTVLTQETSDFETLLDRNQHRFREQVLLEMRHAKVSDLTDPGLGLIKRRILEKSNTLFGRPILQSVIFSDFSFVEQ